MRNRIELIASCHHFVAVLLVTLVSGCATFSESSDYAISGVIEQVLQLGEIRSVSIRCYCPVRIIKKGDVSDSLKLVIRGTDRSVGYHGDQSIPDVVHPSLLDLKEKRSGQKMTLESHEYTYIHHAFIIDKLVVFAPQNVEIDFSLIEYSDLEGREIE